MDQETLGKSGFRWNLQTEPPSGEFQENTIGDVIITYHIREEIKSCKETDLHYSF